MVKKIITRVVLLSTLVLFIGCGEDNAHDGENGLISSTLSTQTDVLVSIQNNILLSNAEQLLSKTTEVEARLNSFDENLTTADVELLQTDFSEIITIWKKVEAIYVASDYNDSMRTIPINIDFFNQGKNLDVATNIDYVLTLDGALQTIQVSNPSKTVTGLEYLIFSDQASITDVLALMNKNDRKRIELIKLSIERIKTNALLIQEFYSNDLKFQEDLEETLNILVNTLVQSSYNLREIRIGEAAGFIVKTKDNPDAELLEYYRSQQSLEAIKAILAAHNQIMGEESFINFGSFASSNGAEEIVNKIRANITNALAICDEFSNPLHASITDVDVDEKVERLYDEITDLQKNYFESLINALDLTADIIEADGD